jgi:hypothetical protein
MKTRDEMESIREQRVRDGVIVAADAEALRKAEHKAQNDREAAALSDMRDARDFPNVETRLAALESRVDMLDGKKTPKPKPVKTSFGPYGDEPYGPYPHPLRRINERVRGER